MVVMFKQAMEMYNDTFANYAKAALLTYVSLTLIVLMFIITSHHLSGFVMVFLTCFSIEERWKRVSSVNEFHDIAITLITCAKYHAPL